MKYLFSIFVLVAASCTGPNLPSSAPLTSDVGQDPPPDVPAAFPAGEPVELLTVDDPRASGMEALGTFELFHDDELNCLYTPSEDNNGEPGTAGRQVIVWPFGYTAVAQGDVVTVFNADGKAVTTTGVVFQIAGGGGAFAADYCDAVGVWYASSEPRAIGG